VLKDEAMRIGKEMGAIEAAELSPVLMLGSNSRLNGPEGQSFISKYVIAPNELRGVQFFHTDLEDAPGVDISGDLFDDDVLEALKQLNARTIVCANILEHVERPASLVDRCLSLLPTSGYIVITVPNRFPYHPAPIDTYFRPDGAALASLCNNSQIITVDEFDCGSFALQLSKRPQLVVRYALHIMLFLVSFRRAVSGLHRFLWLVRNYNITIVVAKKL